MLDREWVRGPQWASEAARRAWESPLARAAAAWRELELISAPSVRPSALVDLDAVDVPAAVADAIRTGLRATPVASAAGGGLRVAFHAPGLEVDWAVAWGNDARVGELLGFPACCRAHFERTWAAGRRDTVLTQERPDGAPEANTWLRQLGVRLVPHLPCSADCVASVELGRQIAAAGRASGMGEEVDALLALLRLPVRYSASSAVAIVETPHFRFMAGTTEIGEAARAGEDVAAPPPAPWEDSGFSTREAMAVAHAVLLAAVGPVTSALDLGAGDGSLLAEMARRGGIGPWVGVEKEGDRVARGRGRHPGISLVSGLISTAPWVALGAVDVALIAAPRLQEMGPVETVAVCARLRQSARRLALYAYCDWQGVDLGAGLTHLADAWSFTPMVASGGVRVMVGERRA